MSKNQVQPWMTARTGGFCCRCYARITKGSRIVYGFGKGIWCEVCAEDPVRRASKFAGHCLRCDAFFRAGEQIGWAPRTGHLCFHCVNGKDSARATLSELQRKRLDDALERVRQLSHLSHRTTAAELEYKHNLNILKTEFRDVKIAKQMIERLL